MKNALFLSVLLVNLLGGHPTSAWAPTGIATRKNLPRPIPWTPRSSQPRLYVSSNVEQEKSSQEGAVKNDETSYAFLSATAAGSSKNWKEPIPYSDLTIGVLKENYPGENRVSQTPDSIKGLVKAGFTVVVEAGGKYV
jgi:hypothetical protein